MDFPRRTKAAPASGQRLEIPPTELKNYLSQPHGITNLLTNSQSWDPFCWSGTELSSPMRALYAAEGRGLLTQRGDRAVDVSIQDIANDINSYLKIQGKKEVTLSSVINALAKASKYVHCALCINLIVNRRENTIRLADGYETAENMEKNRFGDIKLPNFEFLQNPKNSQQFCKMQIHNLIGREK